jgi:hypothetical protein
LYWKARFKFKVVSVSLTASSKAGGSGSDWQAEKITPRENNIAIYENTNLRIAGRVEFN